MNKHLKAEHRIIHHQPDNNQRGYYGWPSLARLNNSELVIGASGFRNAHVCPWGRVVLFSSQDNGNTWSAPQVIHNSMIDDRDVGLLVLEDGRLLVSWFTSDTRYYLERGNVSPSNAVNFRQSLATWTEDIVRRELGSFTRLRNTDGSWTPPRPVKGSSPHGPIQLRDGNLFYLTAVFSDTRDNEPLDFSMDTFVGTKIAALVSEDFGETWRESGRFPSPEPPLTRFCEPFAIELEDGAILAQVRSSDFSIWQSYSDDRGTTWSKPVPITEGSPPHLMRHSSGLLIGSYGYRSPGYGQRIMFSPNDGRTWDTGWIIREDGPNSDLGYPSTVELEDGSLFTVYYQPLSGQSNCAIQGSAWRLPDIYR